MASASGRRGGYSPRHPPHQQQLHTGASAAHSPSLHPPPPAYYTQSPPQHGIDLTNFQVPPGWQLALVPSTPQSSAAASGTGGHSLSGQLPILPLFAASGGGGLAAAASGGGGVGGGGSQPTADLLQQLVQQQQQFLVLQQQQLLMQSLGMASASGSAFGGAGIPYGSNTGLLGLGGWPALQAGSPVHLAGGPTGLLPSLSLLPSGCQWTAGTVLKPSLTTRPLCLRWHLQWRSRATRRWLPCPQQRFWQWWRWRRCSQRCAHNRS